MMRRDMNFTPNMRVSTRLRVINEIRLESIFTIKEIDTRGVVSVYESPMLFKQGTGVEVPPRNAPERIAHRRWIEPTERIDEETLVLRAKKLTMQNAQLRVDAGLRAHHNWSVNKIDGVNHALEMLMQQINRPE